MLAEPQTKSAPPAELKLNNDIKPSSLEEIRSKSPFDPKSGNSSQVGSKEKYPQAVQAPVKTSNPFISAGTSGQSNPFMSANKAIPAAAGGPPSAAQGDNPFVRYMT